jgi:hypothetical protein
MGSPMVLEENRIGLMENQIGLLKSELCKESRKSAMFLVGLKIRTAIRFAASVSVRLSLRD